MRTTAPAAAPAAVPVERSNEVRPAPPPASLPGETPVLPIAKLLEVLEQQAPPALIQGEREFAAEGVDVEWASGAEGEILSRVSQIPDLALISMQVECRSTMCRLQAASPISPAGGSRPFTTLVDSIGLEPRWIVAIPDASGALQLVAYLRRERMSR